MGVHISVIFSEQPSIPGRDLEWLYRGIWVGLSDEKFSYNWQHVDFSDESI